MVRPGQGVLHLSRECHLRFVGACILSGISNKVAFSANVLHHLTTRVVDGDGLAHCRERRATGNTYIIDNPSISKHVHQCHMAIFSSQVHDTAFRSSN